jgi:hypothetical protein
MASAGPTHSGMQRSPSCSSRTITWRRDIGSSPGLRRTSRTRTSTDVAPVMVGSSRGSWDSWISRISWISPGSRSRGPSAARAWCSRALTAFTEIPSSAATSRWVRPCR